MAKDNILDKDVLLRKWKELKDSKVSFTIGVDNAFDDTKAYCLVRTINGVTEIILSKSATGKSSEERWKKDFETEVKNIANYFDAQIIKE